MREHLVVVGSSQAGSKMALTGLSCVRPGDLTLVNNREYEVVYNAKEEAYTLRDPYPGCRN